MNDEMIIGLFEERSEDAIVLMDQTYGKILRSTAWNILANQQDMEEVLSDTYIKLWNSIPPQKPKHLLAYAAKLTRNGALSALRQKRRQKRDGRCDILYSELDGCLAAAEDISEHLDEQELAALINRYLSTLSEDSRRLFLRRYFSMDDLNELALDFNMSKHAVSVRLCRIRKGLQSYLRKEGITV